MKVAIVLLALVAVAVARSSNSVQEDGPKCPIPDPLVSEASHVNITLEPILVINNGGQREVLTVTGLSTLSYTYDVKELLLTAEFVINLGEIAMDTMYSAVTGWVDATPLRQETLPSGDFEGAGKATLTAKTVKLDASATLLINIIGNKVTLRTLTVNELSFDSVALDLSAGFLLNGAPVDWATLNANFKVNFEQDMANFKTEVVEKCRVAANTIIGQYTIAELLDLIGSIGGGVGEECPPEL